MARILTVSGSPRTISRSAKLLDHVAREVELAGHDIDHLRILDLPAEALLAGNTADPDIADSIDRLARTLAPTLYLQADETFPLSRIAAVVHPTRPIISYHLLWRDDVHGSWVPFTVPTDEEVIWVSYDSTGAPTDLLEV